MISSKGNPAEGADLIFSGEVLVKNTSTVETEDVSDLFVVRLNDVFYSTSDFALNPNDEVTVRSRKAQSVKVGDKKIFYATKWLFGEGVAVLENYRTDLSPDTKALQERVSTQRTAVQTRQLEDRLKQSVSVVAGKVISVQSLEKTAALDTEHNPEWMEAVVEVDKVLKGNPEGKRQSFLFANSMDVMWFRAPKFREGMAGIFLLSRPEVKDNLMQGNFLYLTSEEDFRKPEELDNITRLLRK